MLLLVILLLPFAAATVSAFLPGGSRDRPAAVAGIATLAALLLTITQFGAINAGIVPQVRYAWLPAFGLDIILRMDGLAWVFTVLVLGIGLLVLLYARYYMSRRDPVHRFYAYVMAFMGAMLGVVLSGNLIQLVVFWELTSATSFLLIGYWQQRNDARRGARMAFTVTTVGGLCLLAGMLLLGHIAGSYELEQVLASGKLIRAHDWYLPTLILVALGALTKSAQFPFHFWLPHAMAAPTPVSSYLHSATMVKAGIFLLIRLWPALAGTPEWSWILGTAGVCTLLLGSWFAIFQYDMKGLLAYSTISHLGLITVLISIGTPSSVVAAIFHTVNHAIFKASLFMAVGIVDHETGTRDMRVLRGLRRAMPHTAALAVVASAAMAGVPFMNGFLSKEMFFAETMVVGGSDNWWMSVAAFVMGLFSVIYSLRFISVFFGPLAHDLPEAPHEPPRWMRAPIECLVLLCILVGVLPERVVGDILAMATRAVLGRDAPAFDLAIWHGVNLPLLMSVFALAGGVACYLLLKKRFGLAQRDRVPILHHIKGAQLYETTMLGLSLGAAWLVRLAGTRRLQPQLQILMAAFVVVPLLLAGPLVPWLLPPPEGFDPLFALLWLVGAGCAVAAAYQAKYHRLAALALVGGTGLATCVTFLWLSAPDLALTQLMVETVTTVLILLGLRWLPPRFRPAHLFTRAPASTQLRRTRDVAIAVTGGLALAAFSYAVLSRPSVPSISGFFVERALREGGGANVVNVLLVDFRGFDTMGEITVLSAVALTVYALLRRFRPAPESIRIPMQQANDVDPAITQKPAQQATSGYLMIQAVYLRFLLPVMGVIAVYFFMRGHNLPGGGFVAGLIFATTLIVQYMVAGTDWVESHLRLRPHRWIGGGLLCACATGLGAWLFNYPFLTSHTAHVTLPLLGALHVPSAFVFDMGVFLVVVGTTMLILVALAHQSLRSRRVPPGLSRAAAVANIPPAKEIR
ncbi:multisubunit potassium/proton antiporter PhaA subunit /multisubunit potassium/proton antiporter PhaB subunit [Pseudoduganella lurida]|uniref:Multisubunit potassium/proton antiporter PhaA subunit /multisubunit potassium/proton antiporter PhaB subunit n=1 Tax=Pseudoduganella lurida TaxID=1036180 RepID=A0A562R0R5_9BURK|nr:monovalent cation/H+ antiporter subunit A [Pseudoduganella lurida]TWI62627.1 multisubunit potassium/proton antiporter PhaA subunit /multisubunit potassium/proton antiporter PhaB subunit [Pseudoduganella lurida]